MIKAIIVDAEKNERDKVASVLADCKDIKIVASGKDAYDALKLSGCLKPDIVIMDNRLEFIEGEDLPPLVKARSPATAVVILTSKINDRQLFRILSNEAAGIVYKKTDTKILPDILKYIAEGGFFISPGLGGRVLRIFSEICRKAGGMYICKGKDPAGCFSKTELRILTGIGRGETSKEIAESLNLSAGTVRNRISAVMRKIGLRNRPEITRYAILHGLVPLKTIRMEEFGIEELEMREEE